MVQAGLNYLINSGILWVDKPCGLFQVNMSRVRMTMRKARQRAVL
jgi:hypothetical protein